MEKTKLHIISLLNEIKSYEEKFTFRYSRVFLAYERSNFGDSAPLIVGDFISPLGDQKVNSSKGILAMADYSLYKSKWLLSSNEGTCRQADVTSDSGILYTLYRILCRESEEQNK